MNSLADLNLTPTKSMALDRLSELPDAILHVILSLLPMREVAATMLLAPRWKYLWITVPCLHFHFRKGKDTLDQFPNFVKGALIRWKGEKILKFSINLRDMGFGHDHDDLDSWLLFAVEKQVEELCVKLVHDDYYLPDPVYLCSSIRKLSLHSLQLVVKENVSWNRLNSLTIDLAFDFNKNVLNHILLCAPLLEVFDLRTEPICGDLNIRSTSLKMLKIYFYDDDDPPVVRVYAPILQSLEFAGIRYTSCLLKLLSFTFDGILEVELKCDIEVGEMFTEAVRGISHAVNLTSNKWSLSLLVDEWKDDNFELFSNAKFLKLCAVDAEGMLNVLGMFPELEMLIIERMENGDYNPMECDSTFPHPSLLHLKRLEITWCTHDDDPIIPVIKTLLENAPVLDKTVLRLGMHRADHLANLADLAIFMS